MEQDLALEPGDYEFLTLKKEIEAGETLERMEYHWINPDADRKLQQGLDADWLEQLKGWIQDGRWLKRAYPDGREGKLDTVLVRLDYHIGLLYQLGGGAVLPDFPVSGWDGEGGCFLVFGGELNGETSNGFPIERESHHIQQYGFADLVVVLYVLLHYMGKRTLKMNKVRTREQIPESND